MSPKMYEEVWDASPKECLKWQSFIVLWLRRLVCVWCSGGGGGGCGVCIVEHSQYLFSSIISHTHDVDDDFPRLHPHAEAMFMKEMTNFFF